MAPGFSGLMIETRPGIFFETATHLSLFHKAGYQGMCGAILTDFPLPHPWRAHYVSSVLLTVGSMVYALHEVPL
jgi:hypothetical protein